MVRIVADVMTRIVVQMPGETNLVEAARAMREREIGDVLVTDHGLLVGVATDRDIVIRAVAEAMHPADTRLDTIASRDVLRIDGRATPEEAAELMRENAVRRLVVVDPGGKVAGIVSLGDLALARDPSTALAAISDGQQFQ